MRNSAGKSERNNESRFIAIGIVLSAVGAVAGLANLLTVAVGKVLDGKGFETYRTFALVEFSYAGVLVFFILVVAVLLLGLVLIWREEREWRALEKNYKGKTE